MTVCGLLDELCVALNRSPGSITLEDTNETLPEWDSIGHLSIVSTLENSFGAIVEEEQFRQFTSIGVLVERLTAQGLLES